MTPEYLQLRDLHKALNADVVKKARVRNSSPPWLKDFAGQLEDPEYVGLSLADRGFLKDLRLLALRRGNKILNDDHYLRVQLRLTPRTLTGPYVYRLRAAGFLEAYDETTNNAATELNPQVGVLESGENDSGLEVEVEVEEPLPLSTSSRKPGKKTEGKVPRYLARVQPVWNAATVGEREHETRVCLEGFTSDEAEVESHLDHLRAQSAVKDKLAKAAA